MRRVVTRTRVGRAYAYALVRDSAEYTARQMRRLLDVLTLGDVVTMARGERDWPSPD